ncbi:MAG: hypothetical protein HOV81_23895 [Kofleriaceae bacterium]|nr:hypothetical protein [Kofleriaceae bacterium]
MKRFVVVASILGLGALAACRGGGTKSKRTGSAAPVEVVTGPQLPDAGHGPGPSADEIEPNDSDEVASPLALGGTARGKIEPENDADFYKLEVDKPGVLSVMLTGVEGMDLTLELVDSAGTLVGKSDRGGARVKEGIPNAGVTAGTYMLIVRQAPKKKAKPARARKGAKAQPATVDMTPAPVYELSTQLVLPGPGNEREPDDDRGTANDLIVADNAIGYLGWAGDKDVWKLSVETLSEKNALDIQVSPIEGVALELEVSDAIGQLLATRKAPRGAPLVVRGLLPVVAPGAPPFHYVTIKGSASNPETSYTLHAAAHVIGTDEEIEPNDLVDKPGQMPADRTVVHATWTPGDVDCFAIAVGDAPRTVDVTVDVPAELDLEVELLVDGKPVASSNKGKKGVVEKVSAPVAPGQQAVIRVRNPDSAATAEAKYDVSVQETTGTGDNAP